MARWLISECYLTVEQIANLTDEQIEKLYLPKPEEKENNVPQKSPYERFRDHWLRQGQSLEVINMRWEELEANRRKAK